MADQAASPLRSVLLTPWHESHGGRMVPFAGYAMPVQYPTGIVAEHAWTRQHAGLFDVSHMGPAFLELADRSGDAEADHAAAAALVEPLVCGDIRSLEPGQLRYTLLLNASGGIIDDLMVGRSPLFPGSLYIVVNAATKDAVFALIEGAAAGRARLTRADDGALFALQGPEALAVMETLIPGVGTLAFMHYAPFPWNNTRLIVSRSGYTGEDGVEILCAPEHAATLWEALVADERVKPVGLGARDSLRLEAGLPLCGHDLDETVSPIEAGLGFAVSKRRRDAADFPGAARILAERAGDLSRVRVGLLVEGAPAREGADILDHSGTAVGRVTSGGFSPTLGRPVALGFVPPALAAPGTRLQVAVRGRGQPAEVASLPFVPHRYVRKPTS